MCLVFFTTSHVFFPENNHRLKFVGFRVAKSRINVRKKHAAIPERKRAVKVWAKIRRSNHASAVMLQTKIVKSKMPGA